MVARFPILSPLIVLMSMESVVLAFDPLDPIVLAERNSDSCSLIHSLHCRFSKTEYGSDGKVKSRFPKCEYWRLGNRFRLLWRDGSGKWCDTSVGDDGVVRSKSNFGKSGRVEVGVIGQFTGHPTPQGDP